MLRQLSSTPTPTPIMEDDTEKSLLADSNDILDDVYLPFVRTDSYGELGLAPQPFREKLRLFIFAILLVPFKSIATIFFVLAVYCVVKLSILLPKSKRSDVVAFCGKYMCRAVLFCLGFIHIEWIIVPENLIKYPHSANSTTPKKPASSEKERQPAIICNHMSWADILVQMARYFPAFVARDQTKSTPIIGPISQAMDCVYVERSKIPNAAQGVSAMVKEHMQLYDQGKLPYSRPMLLFPEGTTTNGKYMMRFRTGAFLAGVPLQPVIMRYGENRVSPSWETIPFIRHIFFILANPTHSLTCYELPVYRPSAAEKADPKLYSCNVRAAMMAFSGLKDTNAAYNDKMHLISLLKKKYGLETEAEAEKQIHVYSQHIVAMKVQSLFKGGKTAAKPAAKPAAKKAAPVKKASSGGKTGGWLGSGSQDLGLDKWYGPDRKLFLPGGLLDRSDVPAYLNGTLPGDYGYDPLGLGKDGGVEKYRTNEVLHARWAMLFTAGAIIPEGLAANGADIKGANWYETGAAMLNGGTLNYFAVPWALIDNPIPLFAVVAANVALMGAVEAYRRSGSGPAGYSPGIGKFDASVFDGVDPLYPGGPFDPLGLADDPEVFQELKVKEIKNGRLAMISGLGFAIQAAVTGEGPYANFTKHVADPFGYNLLTILSSEDRAPVL